MIRNIKILAGSVLLLVLTADLRAERKYVIGSGINFVAGGSTYASVSGLGSEQLPGGFSPFAASYPSIDIKSTGRNSVLNVSYTFGLYRLKSDLDVDSESHALSANLNTRLGERWKLTLSESFEAAPDFTTFNVFRGVISTPQGFDFAYDPVAQRRSSITSLITSNVDYELNSKSNLSFGGSHSLRDYAEDPAFRGRLSDQNRIEGNLGYNRKIDKHRGWNLKYALFRNTFRDFDDALTQNASIGYSHQLTPTVGVSFDLGPSYTNSLRFDQAYPGYNASLRLLKSIRDSQLSIYYTRRSGDSTGMGGVSDSQNAGFGVVLPISRRITVTLDVSAFDSRQRLVDTALADTGRSRGISGSTDLAFALTDHWSLSAGASYQKQGGGSLVDIEQRRVYVALRFRAPEFWRFAK